MSSLKLMYNIIKEKKGKNKGIPGGSVIRRIALIKRFLSKI